MSDKKCIICGRETWHPFLHLWDHLKPYERGGFDCLKGNMAMFGRWRGFLSCLYMASPLINTIVHWRTRGATLDFGPDPMVLHALKIEGDKVRAAITAKDAK